MSVPWLRGVCQVGSRLKFRLLIGTQGGTNVIRQTKAKGIQ